MTHWINDKSRETADVKNAILMGLLQSAKRRAALAAAFFLFLIVLLLAAVHVPGVWPRDLLPALESIELPLLALFGGMAVFEVWLYRRLDNLKWQGRYPEISTRYFNVLLEVSLPTLILLLLASSMGLLQALSSPAPFLYPLFTFMSVLYLDPWLALFGGALGALQFGLLALVLLAPESSLEGFELLSSPNSYHLKCALLLIAGVVTAFLALELRRQMESAIHLALERDHAISIFGQHVSPQVASKLLEQRMEVNSEERHACVLFLDIRDFSALAASQTPAQVMDYLNTLFSPLIDVINQHHGIVNKFLGDGFMAVFGAPKQDDYRCQHALAASQEILRQIKRLNDAGSIPKTRVGIGLHAGRLVTGNVGTRKRKEYTLVGETVNLAARIEEATKTHQASILLSEAVWQGLKDKPDEAENLGPCLLRGQTVPVRLFKID